MESLKPFQWESFVPEKIIFAPTGGVIYIRKRWFNKYSLIKAKERQVFLDDRGIIVDLKDVSYKIHDRVLVTDEVLNDILIQITGMISSDKATDEQRNELRDKYDIVYREKEYRINYERKLQELIANGVCHDEASLASANVSFMGVTYQLHDRQKTTDAILNQLRNDIDTKCTAPNKDEILAKIDNELAFRNTLEDVLKEGDSLRNETVTLQVSLLKLLYNEQKRIVSRKAIVDEIRANNKKPGLRAWIMDAFPRILLPGEQYMKIDPRAIMINTAEQEFHRGPNDTEIETFSYDIDVYVNISDYKQFLEFYDSTKCKNIEDVVDRLTNGYSGTDSPIKNRINSCINTFIYSLPYDDIVRYSKNNSGLAKQMFFSLNNDINKILAKTGLVLDFIDMQKPIKRKLHERMQENAELNKEMEAQEKLAEKRAKIIEKQLEPLRRMYGNKVPPAIASMMINTNAEHSPNIYDFSGLADALAGLSLNNGVNNNRYTIDTLRANIASEVVTAQSVLAQTNQDVNNIDLITSLLSVKYNLNVADVKNEVSSYINSMSNTNNNQNNSGNNNTDEVIDKFIIMGYNFFKQNVPGKTDEEYAESVAHEIESNFGLSADEALELVRNKLGIVSPVNNIITQDDLNNARQYLVDSGLSDESITDDNLAEVIVFFNGTLDKAQVLAAIRNMTGTNPAITAAVEQIKNEGGVFILNENLFADKLVSILTAQGITIDKDTAKGYFSSLNRGGHSM